MTEKKIKIALMSFAHVHAAGYAMIMNQLPGVELLAADPDHGSRPGETGGRAFADAIGVRYVDTYEELLAWGPDGVCICSENAKHRELTELAAAAGAHVLCEKPIATTLADARAMIDACDAAGVNLMMAYPVHFTSAFSALKAAAEAGRLGTVLALTGTNNGQIPMGSRAWFVDPELAGGGSMVDHTVHVAELLDVLLGSQPPTSVYAASNQILYGDEVEVETSGLVSLEYTDTPLGDRVIGTIDCSWSKPPSYPTWGGLTLQLVGTEGIADMDAFNQRVDGHAEPGADGTGGALWLAFGPNADARMVDEFLGSIREGRPATPDGAVGYRTLQVVDAARRSAASGEVVTL